MVRRPAAQIGDYRLVRGGVGNGWQVKWPRGTGRGDRSYNLGVPLSESFAKAEAKFNAWVRAREAALNQDQKWTIEELIKLYIEDRRIEWKRVEKMRFYWKALKPFFGHLQPKDVETEMEIEGEKRTSAHAYAVERQKQGKIVRRKKLDKDKKPIIGADGKPIIEEVRVGTIARATINSELSFLSTAFEWAVKKKHLKEEDKPFVWVPTPGRGRKTALTEHEMALVLAALAEAPFYIRLFFAIALNTAARSEAICELSWDERHVDFKRRIIRFDRLEERSILDTGHEKGRAIVDMTDALHDMLKDAYEWRTVKVNRVIEWNKKPVKKVKRGVKSVFVRAGITRLYMGAHALRHTLASWAAANKVPTHQIQRLLGHKETKTTETVYIEHVDGALLEAANIVNGRMKLVDASRPEIRPKASRQVYEKQRMSAAQKKRFR